MINQAIRSKKEILLVLGLTLLVILLTTSNVIVQYIHSPSNRIFIGIPHYWEDYFYYLDQFYQGAHGAWLTMNNFTQESFPPTLFYFSHIILGKIGGLFGLASYTSYNLSLFFLKGIFILLSYRVIAYMFPHSKSYRIITFLLFLFSTSFPEVAQTDQGQTILMPTRMYRSENLILTRFSNVPEMYVKNILFLMCFILVTKLAVKIQTFFSASETALISRIKNNARWLVVFLAGSSFGITALTIVDAAKAALLLFCFVIFLFFLKPKTNVKKYGIVWTGLFVLLMLPSCGIISYLFLTLNINPLYETAIDWDIAQHVSQLNFFLHKPFYILLSYGSLGIVTCIGLLRYVKEKKNHFHVFSGIMFICAQILFFLPVYTFLPIPGFRFLFSSIYIFSASIGVYGLFTLQKFFRIKIRYLLIIYLGINSITFVSAYIPFVQPLKPPFSDVAYLSQNIFDGFEYLQKNASKNALVLANPHTGIDMMIPGMTGKRSYSGHMLMTLHVEEKDKQADGFLYKWTDQKQAKEFLETNNIDYVFFTSIDGDPDTLARDYPFLKIRYQNPQMMIFSYEYE
jgi:hypothetical protein